MPTEKPKYIVNYRFRWFHGDNTRRFPRHKIFDTPEEAEAFTLGLDSYEMDGSNDIEHQTIEFYPSEDPDQHKYGWYDFEKGAYEVDFLKVLGVDDGRAW